MPVYFGAYVEDWISGVGFEFVACVLANHFALEYLKCFGLGLS